MRPKGREILYREVLTGNTRGWIEGTDQQLAYEKKEGWVRVFRSIADRESDMIKNLRFGLAKHDNDLSVKKSIAIIGGGVSAKMLTPSFINKLRKKGVWIRGCNAAAADLGCDDMVYFDHENFKPEGKYYNSISNFKGRDIYAPHNDKKRKQEDRVTYVPVTLNVEFDIKNGVYYLNNCGAFAFSVAIAQGYNNVLLFGFDFCKSKDGETHYHDKYPDKDSKLVSKNIYEPYITAMDHAATKAVNEFNARILNCSDNSLFDPSGEVTSKFTTQKDILKWI